MSNKNQKAAGNTPAAPKAKRNASKASSRATEIAKKMGVEKVFENPDGEFFTSESLALLSVQGDRKKLTIHQPDVVPAADESEGGEGTEGAEGNGGEGSGEQE